MSAAGLPCPVARNLATAEHYPLGDACTFRGAGTFIRYAAPMEGVEKTARNYLALIQLACTTLWLS